MRLFLKGFRHYCYNVALGINLPYIAILNDS